MINQFPKIIQTKRLIGSIPNLNVLDEYYGMLQNKQFIDCYGVSFNKEEVYGRLISDINHWKQHDFGVWLWHDRGNKEFVGRSGLKFFLLDNKSEVELSYAIRSEYWGKGIAIEMSLISIELAFSILSLSEIICFTRTQNYQSLRVMKKLGFHYEKDFTYMDILHKLHRLAR